MAVNENFTIDLFHQAGLRPKDLSGRSTNARDESDDYRYFYSQEQPPSSHQTSPQKSRLNKAVRSRKLVEILSFIRAQRRRESSADRVGSA